MTTPSLARSMMGHPTTVALRADLAIRAVLSDFPEVDPAADLNELNWNRALSLASVLTNEDEAVSQDFALRVAQGCLLTDDSLDHEREAAAIILERLGNRPALKLATDRDRVTKDAWTQAPAPFQLDIVRRRLELAIPMVGGEIVPGNPFQRRFWTAVESAGWVSVSAPTSAGKSYIVRRWFEEQLAGREQFTGVYLVPTRALIEEVSTDLATQFKEHDVGIYSIPWDAEVADRDRKILVVTQERLHLLQQRFSEQTSDLLFVDEAQKFGDGSRGILLQQAVEEEVRRNPSAQVVFASPLSSNPEMLLEGADESSSPTVVASETITVNQNLLWADKVPRKGTLWKLQVVVDGEPHAVGNFNLDARPEPDSQTLPLVAVALGRSSGGNVVYVNGASDAEKAAKNIYDALGPDADQTDHQGIQDLRELVERTIHREYVLSAVLRRGIAFHYGNMPLLVRSEIEQLFRDGTLKYLVCTSTLLEGVNLPCRNLFARNPKKGNGNPMTASDFWNLAGRAGRWGKEFQGNIVCVDAAKPARWPELPKVRERQPVKRATSAALADVDSVVEFISSGAPIEQSRETPMLETVYSYLATRISSGASLRSLPELSPESASQLETALAEAADGSEISAALVERHAGISPSSMQRLLDRFRTYDDPDELVLGLPGDDLKIYVRALGLCNQELGAKFGNSARQFGIALLINNWMRGYPLARLIAGRIAWLDRKKKEVRISKEIRNVMKDVETIARFEAPKYLACYTDVLNLHLEQLGEEAPEQPDISMMLELGVSRITEVNLMALGLSRTATVGISEYIVADDLDREQVIEWVGTNAELLNVNRPGFVGDQLL